MVLRYEDMRADPETALRRALAFLGTPGTDQQIREAAAYASYDNMKKLEQKQVFRSSGTRLAPGDQANPQSYKVRRAKVGGWRDYFDDEQVAAIDAMLASRPSPPFGYGAPTLAPAERRPEPIRRPGACAAPAEPLDDSAVDHMPRPHCEGGGMAHDR